MISDSFQEELKIDYEKLAAVVDSKDIRKLKSLFKEKRESLSIPTQGNLQLYDMVLDVGTMSEVVNPLHGWNLMIAESKKDAVFGLLDPILNEELIKNPIKNANDPIYVKLDAQTTLKLGEILTPLPPAANTVSVTGFFDRGKTFLLNHLTGTTLPSGKRMTTVGLSVKIPTSEHNHCILLDTAGTNSPIQVEFLSKTREELAKRGELPIVPDIQENPSNLSQEQIEKREQERSSIEQKIREIVRTRALVNKKANEQFLQDLVFQLSDVIIFVVNEMTWNDQQTLEALSLHLQESLKTQSKRMNRIIVVHNYKETTSIEEFEALRKKYVEDCYEGSMILREVFVKGKGEKATVNIFETKGGYMTHVFLAKEGSEAGLVNGPTYEFLINLLNSVACEERESFTKILCSVVRRLLTPYFRGKIDDVSIYYGTSQQGDKELVMKATSSTTSKLKLAKDKLEFNGINLTLASPNVFHPMYDEIRTSESLIIIMDLPGFLSRKKLNSYQNYESHVTYEVDEETNELVIKGNRKIFYRNYQLIKSNKNKEVKNANLTRICQNYKSESNSEEIFVSRKEGEFEKRIKIPRDYVRDKSKMTFNMEHGLLQVFIPRRPVDVRPTIDIDDPDYHKSKIWCF